LKRKFQAKFRDLFTITTVFVLFVCTLFCCVFVVTYFSYNNQRSYLINEYNGNVSNWNSRYKNEFFQTNVQFNQQGAYYQLPSISQSSKIETPSKFDESDFVEYQTLNYQFKLQRLENNFSFPLSDSIQYTVNSPSFNFPLQFDVANPITNCSIENCTNQQTIQVLDVACFIVYPDVPNKMWIFNKTNLGCNVDKSVSSMKNLVLNKNTTTTIQGTLVFRSAYDPLLIAEEISPDLCFGDSVTNQVSIATIVFFVLTGLFCIFCDCYFVLFLLRRGFEYHYKEDDDDSYELEGISSAVSSVEID